MKQIISIFLFISMSILLVRCGNNEDETQKEQDYPRPVQEEDFPRPTREIPPVGRKSPI